MGDYLPGLVVAGIGVLLLMVLVAVTAGALQRFTRASAALRANAPRRAGDRAVARAGRDRPRP